MRLLELRKNGVGSSTLEFHPNLTIVSGLSAASRAAVIRAITSLPSASDPGLGGLVEAHGILFDLTTETLGVLGMGSPLDVLVSADDLPGGNGGPVLDNVTPLFGDNGGSEAEADADAADEDDRAAQAAIEAAQSKLEAAQESLQDIEEAHRVTLEALDRAKLERAAAMEAAQRVQGALDKARRERDIARAQRDGKVDETLSASNREQQLTTDLEAARRAQAELAEAIAELEERDPRPIQVLVDALHQPQSSRLVPSQAAAQLADEFAELQGQLDEVERRLQDDGLSMDQLSQRLEDARFEVAQSERGVAKPEATDDDIRELEAVHEEVLEAERRASGRIGRNAALKKLEESKVKEQSILDRIGFPTWASYVMGSSLLNIDPVAEQRLEQARAELIAAEQAWALLTRQLEEDPDYSSLLDRLEAVFLAAFDILGGETEGDLEERLRNHLVPDEEVSRDDIIEALVYQLSLREVDVAEGANDDTVLGVAEQWLAATGDHWEKYRTLQEQLEEVGNQVTTDERELEMLGADDDSDSQESRQRRYEEAESRVAEILEDLEAVNNIVVDLDGQVEAREMMLLPTELSLTAARAALEAADQKVAELFAARRAANPQAPATRPAALPPSYDRKPEIYDDLPYAADEEGDGTEPADEEAVEFYFLARLAALRNVSHAGSVPLVIDDALGDRDDEEVTRILGKLERMSESVQVIYLTEDDAVIRWADAVGLQRAAAVTPDGELV